VFYETFKTVQTLLSSELCRMFILCVTMQHVIVFRYRICYVEFFVYVSTIGSNNSEWCWERQNQRSY